MRPTVLDAPRQFCPLRHTQAVGHVCSVQDAATTLTWNVWSRRIPKFISWISTLQPSKMQIRGQSNTVRSHLFRHAPLDLREWDHDGHLLASAEPMYTDGMHEHVPFVGHLAQPGLRHVPSGRSVRDDIHHRQQRGESELLHVYQIVRRSRATFQPIIRGRGRKTSRR